MAGIVDDVMGAVGAVSSLAGQVADPAQPNPPTEDRLTAVEQAIVTWGPLLEKLAPLLEKV
jgi:hypothetical protein